MNTTTYINRLAFAFCVSTLVWSSAQAQTGAKAIFEGVDGELKVISTGTKVDRKVAKTSVPKQLGLMAWIKLHDESGGKVDVPISRVFRSGERISVSLRSNKAGYLYVATIGSSGASTILYPKSGDLVSVNPGMTYEVPKQGAIRFDSQAGTEELMVVLSPVPLEQIKLDGGRQIEATTPATSSTVKVASAQVLAAIAKSDGAKDLMFEDEPDKSSAIPATYATMKPNVLNASSKPIVLTMKLKHQ